MRRSRVAALLVALVASLAVGAWTARPLAAQDSPPDVGVEFQLNAGPRSPARTARDVALSG